MNRLYDIFMIPLEALLLKSKRRWLLAAAEGEVLELGAGTGINLKYYDFSRVTHLTVSDLSTGGLLKKRAGINEQAGKIAVTRADAGALPFADNFFDTVVFTLLFCTVPDPVKAASEVKRVLRRGGRVIYIEHVLPEKGLPRFLCRLLTPLWKHLAGGCRLDRPTENLFQKTGFTFIGQAAFGLLFRGGLIIKTR